jgi:hypothetical protein
MIAPHRVEKVMSLSLIEFQLSIRPLLGAPLPSDQSQAYIPLGSGGVAITYEARPGVRFGGLLDLPRALVSLTFDSVPLDEQNAFLKRFDFAFQRGGG